MRCVNNKWIVNYISLLLIILLRVIHFPSASVPDACGRGNSIKSYSFDLPSSSSFFFFLPFTPVTSFSESKKSGYLHSLSAVPTEPIRHAPPSTKK